MITQEMQKRQRRVGRESWVVLADVLEHEAAAALVGFRRGRHAARRA